MKAKRNGGGSEVDPASLEARRRAVYREAVRAVWLGLAVNLALGVAKLVGAIVGHSFAMLSDAVNSLGDVVTGAAVVFAFRVAQKPPDEEHPYGHTRAEAIAGSYVALLVLVSAVWVGIEAIDRLNATHAVPPAWTLVIAGLNVGIKEILYQYKVRVARRSGSSAVMAHAWDHRSDALSALAVLVGLGLVRFGGERFLFADEVAGLIVVAVIIWTAGNLLWGSAQELMDVQAESDLVEAIRGAAAGVKGVQGVDKLFVRKTGLEYLVDIHLEVPGEWTVSAGHDLGHAVKDDLLQRFPQIRDVLVHLEPYPDPHHDAARGWE